MSVEIVHSVCVRQFSLGILTVSCHCVSVASTTISLCSYTTTYNIGRYVFNWIINCKLNKYFMLNSQLFGAFIIVWFTHYVQSRHTHGNGSQNLIIVRKTWHIFPLYVYQMWWKHEMSNTGVYITALDFWWGAIYSLNNVERYRFM